MLHIVPNLFSLNTPFASDLNMQYTLLYSFKTEEYELQKT